MGYEARGQFYSYLPRTGTGIPLHMDAKYEYEIHGPAPKDPNYPHWGVISRYPHGRPNLRDYLHEDKRTEETAGKWVPDDCPQYSEEYGPAHLFVSEYAAGRPGPKIGERLIDVSSSRTTVGLTSAFHDASSVAGASMASNSTAMTMNTAMTIEASPSMFDRACTAFMEEAGEQIYLLTKSKTLTPLPKETTPQGASLSIISPENAKPRTNPIDKKNGQEIKGTWGHLVASNTENGDHHVLEHNGSRFEWKTYSPQPPVSSRHQSHRRPSTER